MYKKILNAVSRPKYDKAKSTDVEMKEPRKSKKAGAVAGSQKLEMILASTLAGELISGSSRRRRIDRRTDSAP